MEYLGLFGLLIVVATLARWFQRAWAVNVPQSPLVFQAIVTIGIASGLAALYQRSEDPYAGWAIGLGLVFLYLSTTGAQRVDGEMIEVGDVVPAFTAPADNDVEFSSSSLAGSRVLLKFFRGHW